MLKKVALVIFSLFVTIAPPSAVLGNNERVIPIFLELTAEVSQAAQKQQLVLPAEPLDFDTTVEWEANIIKKGLSSEKEAAYILFEEIGAKPRQIQRSTASASGSIIIPKRTQIKLTLDAGEYTRLFTSTGAEVKINLKYPEVKIAYSQGNEPYQFNCALSGPADIHDWVWEWGGNQTAAGSRVSHRFSRAGKIPVILKGSGKNSTLNKSYLFDLEVPPLVEIDPKVAPLTGAAELNVNGQVNAIVNYGQQAIYTWNFGNGVELTGPQASNIYAKPGKYLLSLNAKVGDHTYQKSWVVTVLPMTVKANSVVTPSSGPVPLEVVGSLHPVVEGSPTELQFTWEINGEVFKGENFQKKITEPGEYRVVLKTVDKLHPELAIPDEITVIKAGPPELNISPKASLAKGIIPLTVNFEPGLAVKGASVDLIYHWDFGDGVSSNLEKPTYQYKFPGKYEVKLVVADRLHPGNLAISNLLVEVLPPQMQVTAISSVNNGLVPLTVNFNSQVGITGSPCEPLYIWNFGDGEVSYEQNPVHVYRTEGTFQAKLTVVDRLHPEKTASETTLEIKTKMPKLRLTASVLPASGSAPLIINCQAWGEKEGVSNPKLKYLWDFGDGKKSEKMEEKHIFERPGTYIVTISIIDEELGLKESKTFKVNVK